FLYKKVELTEIIRLKRNYTFSFRLSILEVGSFVIKDKEMSEQDDLQNMDTSKTIAPNDELLASKIYIIRDQKVMLDRDLAELYGVETFRLNEQIKRNINRFPEDFMFQLSKQEWESLISQIAMSKKGRGGRRT